MGKLKKSIPDEDIQPPSRKMSGGGQRKTPSNKVGSSKYSSSFKDSGKKRTSNTPVSPSSRGAN
jgi:hypothetical protein